MNDFKRDKRIRNMYYTIGEDYSSPIVYNTDELLLHGLNDVEIDMFLLYAAAMDGALHKYSDKIILADYIKSRLLLGMNKDILTPLVKLAEDIRIDFIIMKIRQGYMNIKKQGLQIIINKMLKTDNNDIATLFTKINIAYMDFPCDNEIAILISNKLKKIDKCKTMLQFFSLIDSIYTTHWGGNLSDTSIASLEKIAMECNDEATTDNTQWQVDNSDDTLSDMSDIIEDEIDEDGGAILLSDNTEEVSADTSILAQLDETTDDIDIISDSDIKEMLNGCSIDELIDKDILEKIKRKVKEKAIFEGETTDTEISQRQRMNFFYGASFIPDDVLVNMERELCQGVHANFKLHITDGAIRSNIGNEYQSLMLDKQKTFNVNAYNENLAYNILSIKKLTTMLEEILNLIKEKNTYIAKTGTVIPRKIWQALKTNNNSIFEKTDQDENDNFAVDLLLDASGSQGGRQNTISAQAYIVASALINCHIPCRVLSFCNFSDYTIIRRFRDYGDKINANENIFEYTTSGNNRDGLAIRVASNSLLKRNEEKKLLIVLSDGQPADIGIGKNYDKQYGTLDTASQVRFLRQKGVHILGVYTGNRENLEQERYMYGNDFAYITDPHQLAHNIVKNISRILLE